MTWPMRHSSMYRNPFRLRQRPETDGEPDYGEFLNQVTIMSADGPLSASSPGDITKWMAVPWQTDTASCRAGYPNTEFPADEFIPTFWPSRVPNNVLTEANYQIVTDGSRPMEERVAAFNDRPFWLRSLDFRKPYVEQITTMVHHFGELGLIEKREGDSGPDFPQVTYVETLPAQAPLTAKAAALKAEPEPATRTEPVTDEFAHARFGRLRRPMV